MIWQIGTIISWLSIWVIGYYATVIKGSMPIEIFWIITGLVHSVMAFLYCNDKAHRSKRTEWDDDDLSYRVKRHGK